MWRHLIKRWQNKVMQDSVTQKVSMPAKKDECLQ